MGKTLLSVIESIASQMIILAGPILVAGHEQLLLQLLWLQIPEQNLSRVEVS
jgi:hypothetical protein